MKISTKGRYGLRFMIELAGANPGLPVSAEDISRNQQISENYLHILARSLKKNGLISASRGPAGGYLINGSPEQISVLDIIRATEGNTSVVACLNRKQVCKKTGNCSTQKVWQKLTSAIDKTLAGISLGELAQQVRNSSCVYEQGE
jgi:Rrf2 family protein